MRAYPSVHPLIKIGLVLSSPLNDSPIPREEPIHRIGLSFEYIYIYISDQRRNIQKSSWHNLFHLPSPFFHSSLTYPFYCIIFLERNFWKHKLKDGLIPSFLQRYLSWLSLYSFFLSLFFSFFFFLLILLYNRRKYF